jgi:hypothetical protein
MAFVQRVDHDAAVRGGVEAVSGEKAVWKLKLTGTDDQVEQI